MTCRIIHVDDHELTRAGCRLLFAREPDFEIVGELDRGENVLDFARKDPPDVLLLDVALPDMNGMSLLAELVGVLEIPVVILTGQNNVRDFAFALKMGAKGVVGKVDPATEIIAAVASAHRGETYISPSAAELLAAVGEPKIELSPRQTAILHFMSIGETNKEISYKIGISMPTVSFHLAEMRRKLGVDTNKRILNAAKSAQLI